MPRGVKKEHLPTKICVVCNRPFNWRKKWERVWDEVTTCSKSCNRKRKESNRKLNNSSLQSISNTNDESIFTIPSAIGDAHTYINDESDFDEVIRRDTEVNNSREAASDSVECDDSKVTSSATPISFLDELTMLDILMDNNDDIDTNSVSCCHSDNEKEISQSDEKSNDDPIARKKAERKAAKKRKKAERRAQREGRGDPSAGQKSCDMCGKKVDLLIRCMHEQSKTEWSMVCGKCWNVASGGVVDGDAKHPHYRYGGLWKNRRRQQK